VTGPSVLDLFAGIGGLSLGLERAGFTIAGQVEIDPRCRSILARHWPEVPRHDDVRTAPAWWAARPAPDVVAGGFPCQPVSGAGRRLAQADPRWLWPAMADVIAATGPAWVIIENVPGLRSRGLADVLSDLARLGYRARPGLISACQMGAPHVRKRLFTLAHAQSLRCGQRQPERPDRDDPPLRPGPLADPQRVRRLPARRDPWADEPRLDRVAYGVPDRVDRTRGLGNAVVPAVAEHIGQMILPHIPASRAAA
jgi:DNA (cytosine-5)-methyltransferase 1